MTIDEMRSAVGEREVEIARLLSDTSRFPLLAASVGSCAWPDSGLSPGSVPAVRAVVDLKVMAYQHGVRLSDVGAAESLERALGAALASVVSP